MAVMAATAHHPERARQGKGKPKSRFGGIRSDWPPSADEAGQK